MPGCLHDLPWRISYGPADDRLRDFYIPALSRSVLYERTAGFFSSSALAVAAAGVAHLVRAGGRMRLLVGADLSEEDVRAVERGEEEFGRVVEHRLLDALEELVADPSDPARRRVEVLAWMVARGMLEIRVVLPRGPDGRPLPADRALDYFHPKEGLFTDACGHQLAFSGSVNESAQGWERNYEQFMVYTSWESSRPYLLQVAERIARLWEGREKGWLALPVPEAVRQRLLALAPDREPEGDPLEAAPPPTWALPPDQAERVLFQFLRDAPELPGGELVGMCTAAFTPWPHQTRIAAEVIRRFPERFLLADEVGLGKTIEAGLVIRALVLAGEVRRGLILVPKGVLRQWQEELFEKLALNVPAYDGRGFHDYFRDLPTPTGNPWDAYPILLASSQLAKRMERRAELLAAGPFDLVVVDEAHHARRREFLAPRYRPNRLLSLLEGEGGRPGLSARTRGLLLLTATPMQIHPVEVYDLLRQLDLPPAWAAAEDRFLRFLSELRRAGSGEDADWGLLLRLGRDALDGQHPEQRVPGVPEKLGTVEWELVDGLLRGARPVDDVRRLSPQGRATLLEICRRASPLGSKMFRTTRELLRRYREQGLLSDLIPSRHPVPVWIEMSEPEWELYQKVEDYVAEGYQRLEGERRGLGFIMTVYSRRLTSSFAALRRSLERRRAFLVERSGPAFGLTDEDTEDADLEKDVTEELEESLRQGRLSPSLERLLQGELRQLDALLEGIARLPEDTKFSQLVKDLSDLLSQRETVAVFTHYTDTMDDLRDRLVGLYGSRLACYSGRGGERFQDKGWVPASKEEVKNAFRSGEVQVLLCTEAASEGLNLQTCGVLVNYDVPWNPMRVEQRIGRFDRIGQRFQEVWIKHYFLLGPGGQETVEAKVYRALGDRIDWFRCVVGEVQPILARVANAIEQAAVTTGARREQVLEQALTEIRNEIETQQAQPLSMEDWSGVPEDGAGGIPPVSLQDLERVLLDSSIGPRFHSHPDLPGAYRLELEGRIWEVTFDPEVADGHPGRVRLLTYGEELLERLLDLPGVPLSAAEGVGLIRVAGPSLKRWFMPEDPGGLREILRLHDLQRCLEEGRARVEAEHVAQAREAAQREVLGREQQEEDLQRRQVAREQKVLEEHGRLLLAEASACEGVLRSVSDAQLAAQMLMDLGYPWGSLGKLVGYPDFVEVEESRAPIAGEAQARSRQQELRERAKELVHRLAGPAQGQLDVGSSGPGTGSTESPAPLVDVLLLRSEPR